MLVLVNEQDEAVGYLDKDSAHNGAGILHRAFSIFLFNDKNQVLLQKRSDQKRLWPGYWSNSCCSHPRQGEEISEATYRRARQELGIEVFALQYLYKFVYQASFGDLGSEHELCWVYIGKCQDTVKPNKLEISDHRWLESAQLTAEMEAHPERFTPWMKQEWHQLMTQYKSHCEAI